MPEVVTPHGIVNIDKETAALRELLAGATDADLLAADLTPRLGLLRAAYWAKPNSFSESDVLFLSSLKALITAISVLETVHEDMRDVRYRGDAMEIALRLEAVVQHLPLGSVIRGRAEKEARDCRERFKLLPSRIETEVSNTVRMMERRLLRLRPFCNVCSRPKLLVHHGELAFSWGCEFDHKRLNANDEALLDDQL